MHTVITSKFQTTIPKRIRERLHLSIHDKLDWGIENGKIVVSPSKPKFLDLRGSIKIGAGDIAGDIQAAREQRLQKFK